MSLLHSTKLERVREYPAGNLITVRWCRLEEFDLRPESEWSVLSDDELLQAARYVWDVDRNRFVAGRSMLRSILAGPLSCEPAAVPLITVQRSLVYLAADARSGQSFSFSDTQGMIVIAVAPADVALGVAVEIVTAARGLSEFRRALGKEETNYISSHPTVGRSKALLRLWTRKRALSEADGGYAVDRLSVSVLDNVANEYNLQDLSLTDVHVGALAFDGRVTTSIKVAEWPG